MENYKYKIDYCYGMPVDTTIERIISPEYETIEEAERYSIIESNKLNGYSNIRWIRTSILNKNNKKINNINTNNPVCTIL